MRIQPGNAYLLTFQSTCMKNLEQTMKLILLQPFSLCVIVLLL